MAFPRLHKTFISDRGRPYTDTPFVILPGMLKSSQPIGDDPNLWMALSLTYNFVRYSYMYIYIYMIKSSIYIYIPNRRKFRSQTSDNMDRWKSSGKSQRGEEKKWEDQRRERESVKNWSFEPFLTQMSKKCTLTNLTKTNLTNSTNLTNLTNLTNPTNLTKL